ERIEIGAVGVKSTPSQFIENRHGNRRVDGTVEFDRKTKFAIWMKRRALEFVGLALVHRFGGHEFGLGCSHWVQSFVSTQRVVPSSTQSLPHVAIHCCR